MNDFESLPGCLGLYEALLSPNGSCGIYPQREICCYITQHFVSRKAVLERLAKIERVLKGE